MPWWIYLILSVVIAVAVLLITKNLFLSCIGFVIIPCLSLSFWLCNHLGLPSPNPLMPNWISAALIILAFMFVIWDRSTPQVSHDINKEATK